MVYIYSINTDSFIARSSCIVRKTNIIYLKATDKKNNAMQFDLEPHLFELLDNINKFCAEKNLQHEFQIVNNNYIPIKKL